MQEGASGLLANLKISGVLPAESLWPRISFHGGERYLEKSHDLINRESRVDVGLRLQVNILKRGNWPNELKISSSKDAVAQLRLNR